jgi:subtilisin family serine protease
MAGQEWWLAHIGADRATPPGPGVPITVVDSGVDPTHPEFAGRPNTVFMNDQTVAGRDEYHGTAVAAFAAAPENGAGLVGVYPQAVLQSWDASPTAGGFDDANAVNGIRAAAEHCPGVINISWGSTRRSATLEAAVLYAFHQGCLVVAAAGNDGQRGNPPEFPADYPHVLTIGASNEEDGPAPFSTISPALDLAAPGINMPGAVPMAQNPTGYVPDLDGTSFAAPLVTAAAAWVWTVRPDLDVTQLFEIMRASARDVGTPGFDSTAGYGILDIPAALALAPPAPDPYEPNDDVDQVAPGRLFALGDPWLTTSGKPSSRISGRLDASEDPRDLYRIWVPPHRVVRVSVAAGGDATARIWGPKTVSVREGIGPRRRDLKGQLIRGGNQGFGAYAEVLLTSRSRTAAYVVSVTAATR